MKIGNTISEYMYKFPKNSHLLSFWYKYDSLNENDSNISKILWSGKMKKIMRHLGYVVKKLFHWGDGLEHLINKEDYARFFTHWCMDYRSFKVKDNPFYVCLLIRVNLVIGMVNKEVECINRVANIVEDNKNTKKKTQEGDLEPESSYSYDFNNMAPYKSPSHLDLATYYRCRRSYYVENDSLESFQVTKKTDTLEEYSDSTTLEMNNALSFEIFENGTSFMKKDSPITMYYTMLKVLSLNIETHHELVGFLKDTLMKFKENGYVVKSNYMEIESYGMIVKQTLLKILEVSEAIKTLQPLLKRCNDENNLHQDLATLLGNYNINTESCLKYDPSVQGLLDGVMQRTKDLEADPTEVIDERVDYILRLLDDIGKTNDNLLGHDFVSMSGNDVNVASYITDRVEKDGGYKSNMLDTRTMDRPFKDDFDNGQEVLKEDTYERLLKLIKNSQATQSVIPNGMSSDFEEMVVKEPKVVDTKKEWFGFKRYYDEVSFNHVLFKLRVFLNNHVFMCKWLMENYEESFRSPSDSSITEKECEIIKMIHMKVPKRKHAQDSRYIRKIPLGVYCLQRAQKFYKRHSVTKLPWSICLFDHLAVNKCDNLGVLTGKWLDITKSILVRKNIFNSMNELISNGDDYPNDASLIERSISKVKNLMPFVNNMFCNMRLMYRYFKHHHPVDISNGDTIQTSAWYNPVHWNDLTEFEVEGYISKIFSWGLSNNLPYLRLFNMLPIMEVDGKVLRCMDLIERKDDCIKPIYGSEYSLFYATILCGLAFNMYRALIHDNFSPSIAEPVVLMDSFATTSTKTFPSTTKIPIIPTRGCVGGRVVNGDDDDDDDVEWFGLKVIPIEFLEDGEWYGSSLMKNRHSGCSEKCILKDESISESVQAKKNNVDPNTCTKQPRYILNLRRIYENQSPNQCDSSSQITISFLNNFHYLLMMNISKLALHLVAKRSVPDIAIYRLKKMSKTKVNINEVETRSVQDHKIPYAVLYKEKTKIEHVDVLYSDFNDDSLPYFSDCVTNTAHLEQKKNKNKKNNNKSEGLVAFIAKPTVVGKTKDVDQYKLNDIGVDNNIDQSFNIDGKNNGPTVNLNFETSEVVKKKMYAERFTQKYKQKRRNPENDPSEDSLLEKERRTREDANVNKRKYQVERKTANMIKNTPIVPKNDVLAMWKLFYKCKCWKSCGRILELKLVDTSNSSPHFYIFIKRLTMLSLTGGYTERMVTSDIEDMITLYGYKWDQKLRKYDFLNSIRPKSPEDLYRTHLEEDGCDKLVELNGKTKPFEKSTKTRPTVDSVTNRNKLTHEIKSERLKRYARRLEIEGKDGFYNYTYRPDFTSILFLFTSLFQKNNDSEQGDFIKPKSDIQSFVKFYTMQQLLSHYIVRECYLNYVDSFGYVGKTLLLDYNGFKRSVDYATNSMRMNIYERVNLNIDISSGNSRSYPFMPSVNDFRFKDVKNTLDYSMMRRQNNSESSISKRIENTKSDLGVETKSMITVYNKADSKSKQKRIQLFDKDSWLQLIYESALMTVKDLFPVQIKYKNFESTVLSFMDKYQETLIKKEMHMKLDIDLLVNLKMSSHKLLENTKYFPPTGVSESTVENTLTILKDMKRSILEILGKMSDVIVLEESSPFNFCKRNKAMGLDYDKLMRRKGHLKLSELGDYIFLNPDESIWEKIDLRDETISKRVYNIIFELIEHLLKLKIHLFLIWNNERILNPVEKNKIWRFSLKLHPLSTYFIHEVDENSTVEKTTHCNDCENDGSDNACIKIRHYDEPSDVELRDANLIYTG